MDDDDQRPELDARFREMIARIDEKIEEHGHTCLWVGADAKSPAFTYTVGMTESEWPELVCMSLGPDSGLTIVNCVVSRLRELETKPHNAMLVTEALNVPVYLIEISESLVPHYFKASAARLARVGMNGRKIRGFQVVWPDTSGKFPWNSGYDQDRYPQILLGSFHNHANDNTKN